ncbi:MAG: hypothetical protein EBQ92_04560 [Proteobacteria bacterium]|nr:hypothetical protein [Pseudomonadota bacterium]
MRNFISLKTSLLILVLSLSAQASLAPFSDISSIRREFLEDHRVFEKVIEGKSEWESTFCHGVYSYRIMVRTQLKDLDIQLDQDGSVILKAVLHEPYVGFQGNYQGAYSFCFPVSDWSGLTAEDAKIEAKVEFTDTEEGRILVNIKVNSVKLGRLMSDSLYQSWEESMTRLVNNGLSQVWASQLGDWFSSKISSMVNEHLPSLPKGK